MFRNYFKVAFRSLARNKAFSFINFFGLAIGLATCMLIMLYIFDEASYDKYHKDGERTYRIASIGRNETETWAATPAPLAFALKAELPEVEQVARILTFPDVAKMLIKDNSGADAKQFIEQNGYYVDSTFFQIFTYDFIYGNTVNALHKPNTMVVSQELSQKFFGKSNPVGKALIIKTPFGDMNYTIDGVFDEKKVKSHIPSNFFLSMRNNDMGTWEQNQKNWITNNIFFAYVKLNPGTDQKAFDKKLNAFFQHHVGNGFKEAGFSKTLYTQPLSEIYLHSAIGNEIGANGNIKYLYILASIAIFILLIACINFMNLSTARSEKRAKEVGVRKVMGAQKKILVQQFLVESVLMSLIALAIAAIACQLMLPAFNSLTQKKLEFFDQPSIFLWIAALGLFTGLFAGLYPAFYLSAFKPVSVLKGKVLNSLSATTIRKGLVVFQFSISICLIVAVIVVTQQLNFIEKQPLGFKKEQQIILPMKLENVEQKYSDLRNELLKLSQIKTVTVGSTYPGINSLDDMLFYAEGKTTLNNVDVHIAAIGDDYMNTLGITVLRGRTFSKEFTGDSASIVLNETALRDLGYKLDEAVGRKINYDFSKFKGSFTIVGVVKDFNFESLHNKIRPFGFTAGVFANKYSYTVASFNLSNLPSLIKNIEGIWKKIAPGIPFEYSFIDQDLKRNYQKEQRTATLVTYFSLVAIAIACLGLFGLAAFSAEQRKKEIGIRKVLGASVVNITSLMSKDFMKLVVIAILIATPLAWYFMNKWLMNFEYKINISWWMLLVAAIGSLTIAFATVSFQAIKSALRNPVSSIRSE